MVDLDVERFQTEHAVAQQFSALQMRVLGEND